MKPNDRVKCVKEKNSPLRNNTFYHVEAVSRSIVKLTCSPLWFAQGRFVVVGPAFELLEVKGEQI